VKRAEGGGVEDEHVESALWKVAWVIHGSGVS